VSHSSLGAEFCLLASASPLGPLLRNALPGSRSGCHPRQSADHSPTPPRCSGPQSSQTGGVADRCHGNGRAGSWKRSNDLAPHPSDRGDRTSDKQGSDAPPHTDDVPRLVRPWAIKPHQARALPWRQSPRVFAWLSDQDFGSVFVIPCAQRASHIIGATQSKAEAVTCILVLGRVFLEVFPEFRDPRVFRRNLGHVTAGEGCLKRF